MRKINANLFTKISDDCFPTIAITDENRKHMERLIKDATPKLTDKSLIKQLEESIKSYQDRQNTLTEEEIKTNFKNYLKEVLLIRIPLLKEK